MHIARNAVFMSAALILSVGAVAHASGGSNDKTAGYYGQPNSRSHSDDNRPGYYGQANTSSAPVVASRAHASHKQVLAKEVNSTYLFDPRTVKIKVGTTITWSNRSDAEHNVTFDKNAKVNMDFKPSKSVSYTFTKAGTFSYHCEYHPFMKGTVIVQP